MLPFCVPRVSKSCKRLSLPFLILQTVSPLICILILCASDAYSAEATLAWDPSAEAGVAGYKVYYGTRSGEYTSCEDAGNQTSYTISGLQEGKTYYLAATAYDAYGDESGFSEEVTYKVPQDSTLNQAPLALDGTLVAQEDTEAYGTLCASDPDGDALTYSIVVNGSIGTATVTSAATGTYTYVPHADAAGTDTFTFKAADGTLESSPATVTVTITPANGSPEASDDFETTEQGTPVVVAVLANDSDPEDNTLTLVSVTQPQDGAATADGCNVRYTPNPQFLGTDTFSYTVSDGSDTATGSVTIAVVPAPDISPPAAVTDLATSGASVNSITLTWTAPGDDGTSGTASDYVIRYSPWPITEATWAAAAECSSPPTPSPAGTLESFTVADLFPNTTYCFSLKTADEVPNWSATSNTSVGMTAGAIHIEHMAVTLQVRTAGKKHSFTRGVVALTVADAADNPVENVTVSGRWYGLTSDTDCGITDATGTLTFTSDQVKSQTGAFSFYIDDVTKEGCTYDPAANYDFDDDGVEGDTAGSVIAVAKIGAEAGLGAAYPNPANPGTNIRYSVARPGVVTLRIYNVMGQLVRTLVDDVRPSETRTVAWDGSDDFGDVVASGNYLYRLCSGAYSETRRVVLIR